MANEGQRLGPERNTLPLMKRDKLVTASASLGPTDDLVLADATAGNVTLSPPPAANMRGRSITVIKTNATNSVIFDPDGAETVNGAATNTMTAQYDKRTYSAVLITSPNTYGWLISR